MFSVITHSGKTGTIIYLLYHQQYEENSIRDARTRQSGEIFLTPWDIEVLYVQSAGYFQNIVSYIKVQTMFK